MEKNTTNQSFCQEENREKVSIRQIIEHLERESEGIRELRAFPLFIKKVDWNLLEEKS